MRWLRNLLAGAACLLTLATQAAAQQVTFYRSVATASMVVTPVAGITQDAITGTTVANISSKNPGSTLAVSPSDGRIIPAGSDIAGWRLIKGLVSWSPSTIPVTVTGSDSQVGSGNIVVNSNPSYTALVANTRLAIAGITTSTNVASEIAALLASSTNKTKPSVAVADGTTVSVVFQSGAAAAGGVLLDYITNGSNSLSYVFDYSDDSGATWTTVSTMQLFVAGQSEATRGQVQPFPASAPSGRWYRASVTNASGAGTSVQFGIYQNTAATKDMDLLPLVGQSVTFQDSQANNAENMIKKVDPTRDPIVINLGVFGYSLANMQANELPLITAAVSAGVPFAYILDDLGGAVDIVSHRPYSTAGYASTYTASIMSLVNAEVSAGFSTIHQLWSDSDYINWQSDSGSCCVVAGIAAPQNGTTPYNQNVVAPVYKSGGFAATWHPGWDSPANQVSTPTTMWLESMFGDGTTHPNSPFYNIVNRKWVPGMRYLSGMPIGRTGLETFVVDSYQQYTTPYRKQRLLDVLGFLPPTADLTATAVRAQATAFVNGLDTNPADYTDPPGVVRPDQRTTAPTYWLSSGYLPNVTKFAALSARIGSLSPRIGAGPIVPATGTGIYYIENAAGGHGVLRGNPTNVTNTPGEVGSDGPFNAGYMVVAAGDQTIIDGTTDFTIEFDYRDTGVSTTATMWGSPTFSFSAIAGRAPVFSFSGHTITGSTLVQFDVMHHYAITYSSAGPLWTLYMDGVSVGTNTNAKVVTTNALSALMGNTGLRCTGDLGDFTVTPAALNSTDLNLGRLWSQAMYGTP